MTIMAWLGLLFCSVALWALLMLVVLARRGVEELSFTRAAVARIEDRQIRAMTPGARMERMVP